MLRPCFKLQACFYIKAMFQYQWHVFISSPCFRSRACFISTFLIYFMVYYLFLCFIISIHSKDIHPKITSSFCKFLCFISYDFNMCHIFISCISFVFYILGLFLSSDFFVFFFLANWLGGTSHVAPLYESVILLQ